jgi:hypothetical protein
LKIKIIEKKAIIHGREKQKKQGYGVGKNLKIEKLK